jgi:hypothetical protein
MLRFVLQGHKGSLALLQQSQPLCRVDASNKAHKAFLEIDLAVMLQLRFQQYVPRIYNHSAVG